MYVSFYNHHSKLVLNCNATFEQYLELFLEGCFLYCPIVPYLKSFFNSVHPKEKILFLKYEDMISDLGSEVTKTAKFLDIDLKEDELPRFLEHLSFAHFKKNRHFELYANG